MPDRGKRRKTVEELEAELRADPEWVAQEKLRDEEVENRAQELRDAQGPLLQELRSVGLDLDTVWRLVNVPNTPEAAIPVLIRHLHGNYPARVREGIARALAVPEARPAWDILVSSFRASAIANDGDVSVGLACALDAMAVAADFDTIAELVAAPQYGEARGILVYTLAKLSRERARKILEPLKDDPDLAQNIKPALKGKRSVD